MTERPLFKYAEHVPKVWGVTYTELFISLGVGLLITTVGFAFSGEATTVAKISLLGMGFVATGVIYGVCFLYEAQDPLKEATFIKNELNSQSLPNAKVQITGDPNAL